MGLAPGPRRRSSHGNPVLEAESVHILREVAAGFEEPVMLYAIGKDSSDMLHLALEASHRGWPPFPLLHVDTTREVRDMILLTRPSERQGRVIDHDQASSMELKKRQGYAS